MADLHHCLCRAVVGAKQAAVGVPVIHSAQQVHKVVAGGALSEKDIHAAADSVAQVLRGGTFMVGEDSGCAVGIKSGAESQIMAVNDLVGVLGNKDLVHDIVLCGTDTDEVHHLSKTKYPWMVDAF